MDYYTDIRCVQNNRTIVNLAMIGGEENKTGAVLETCPVMYEEWKTYSVIIIFYSFTYYDGHFMVIFFLFFFRKPFLEYSCATFIIVIIIILCRAHARRYRSPILSFLPPPHYYPWRNLASRLQPTRCRFQLLCLRYVQVYKNEFCK